jgi:hypothetical protein
VLGIVLQDAPVRLTADSGGVGIDVIPLHELTHDEFQVRLKEREVKGKEEGLLALFQLLARCMDLRNLVILV